MGQTPGGAGVPIGSPDDFAGSQRIRREVRRPVTAAAARATDVDVDLAGEALEGAQRARLRTLTATSDVRLTHGLRISRAE